MLRHSLKMVKMWPEHIAAIPLQSWTGPEGSRSLRLPDVQTVGRFSW